MSRQKAGEDWKIGFLKIMMKREEREEREDSGQLCMQPPRKVMLMLPDQDWPVEVVVKLKHSIKR
jgi:hypothetical protein